MCMKFQLIVRLYPLSNISQQDDHFGDQCVWNFNWL
jgi:hypothetical protein